MANSPDLILVGKINKEATQTAIQSQLNEISKNLKLTIGATSSQFSKQAEKDATNMKNKYVASQYEIEIKKSKSFEKIETQKRKKKEKKYKKQHKHKKRHESTSKLLV